MTATGEHLGQDRRDPGDTAVRPRVLVVRRHVEETQGGLRSFRRGETAALESHDSMSGPAERGGSRSRSALVALGSLAVLMGALVYLNALPNPFVYDDELTVVGNVSIREFVNWRYVLLGHQFRPLTNQTYALDYAIWGLRP